MKGYAKNEVAIVIGRRCERTLRRMEAANKIRTVRTPAGHRLYCVDDLLHLSRQPRYRGRRTTSVDSDD